VTVPVPYQCHVSVSVRVPVSDINMDVVMNMKLIVLSSSLKTWIFLINCSISSELRLYILSLHRFSI
jgi:hypothetical protein